MNPPELTHLFWSRISLGARQTLIVLCLVLAVSEASYGQEFHFEDESIRSVVEEFERQGVVRFLYRDGLIAGKRVSFTATRPPPSASRDRTHRRRFR